MTEFHSTKVPRWVVAVAAGGVLFRILLIAGPVVLLWAVSGGGRAETPFTSRVTYQVYGTPSTADVFTVRTVGGGDNQRATLPLDSREYSFDATHGQVLHVTCEAKLP